MESQLPQVNDRVWHLLEQMRISMGRVALPDSLKPNHTVMLRPLYDEVREAMVSSTPDNPRTPVYGAGEYRALNILIEPSPAGPVGRLGRRLLGRPEREGENNLDWEENKEIWQQTLVRSLRAVAQFAGVDLNRTRFPDLEPSQDGPAPVFSQAMAGAWTAVNFDKVLADLESPGELPAGTAEHLTLRWDQADAEPQKTLADVKRQEILSAVDEMAPAGYAFAKMVGEQIELGTASTLGTAEVLQRVVSSQPHAAAHAAAELLMDNSPRLKELPGQDLRRYTEMRNQVAASIQTDFNGPRDHGPTAAQLGRETAERAIERVAHLENTLGQPPEPKEIRLVVLDDRLFPLHDLPDPRGAVAPREAGRVDAPAGNTGSAAAASKTNKGVRGKD